MSAAIRKVETSVGTIEYDSDMPIGVLRRLFGSAETGGLDTMIEALSEFIVSWPFDSDPKDASSWDALRRSEFQAVTTGVIQDLAAAGEA